MLQNEKYIEFANENTVEVVALGRLDEAIQKNERKAEEYDAKDESGKPVKYMVEFPGLTREEIIALHQSKASTYNDTKGIPFTAIIDPFIAMSCSTVHPANSFMYLTSAPFSSFAS